MSSSASQHIAALYYLMGEALCMIQLLEDFISHSITLKKDVKYPSNFTKDEAFKMLVKNRAYTLGDAIKLAKKEKLYSDILQKDLKNFLEKRNWLIHKCIPHNLDEIFIPANTEKLFHEIKTISQMATILRHTVDIDLVEFSESIGTDMSNVRSSIKQFRHEI